jgi:hypothetical protein
MMNNMNYELALQLKEAGFPLIKTRKVRGLKPETESTTGEIITTEELNEAYLMPTLSELIEACGDKIVLHSPGSADINEEYYIPSDEDWTAHKQGLDRNKFPDTYGTLRTFGSTPEEALITLWLALNKK